MEMWSKYSPLVYALKYSGFLANPITISIVEKDAWAPLLIVPIAVNMPDVRPGCFTSSSPFTPKINWFTFRYISLKLFGVASDMMCATSPGSAINMAYSARMYSSSCCRVRVIRAKRRPAAMSSAIDFPSSAMHAHVQCGTFAKSEKVVDEPHNDGIVEMRCLRPATCDRAIRIYLRLFLHL